MLKEIKKALRRSGFLRPASSALRLTANALASHKRGSYAAFVAGDHRIFFPAVVALVSLEQHNPRRFDRFVSFDGSQLSNRMSDILQRYGIFFVDSRRLADHTKGYDFREMSEGRWPSEVFLNWAMPGYFLSRGYEYSLKLDYDVLCTGRYSDLRSLFHTNLAISVLHTPAGSTLIPDAVKYKVMSMTGIDCSHSCAINSGVAVINNRLYERNGFYDRLASLYEALSKYAPEIPLLEQVAFAAVGEQMPGGLGKLGSAYNQRVRYTRKVKGLSTGIKNIHFITKFKPWLPFSFSDIQGYARKGQGMIPFYRQAWLEFAADIEGFEEFCSERPMSTDQILALAMLVVEASVPHE